MLINSLLALVASATSTSAVAIRGFNYGAQGMTQDTFQAAFQKAAQLPNAPGFNSARLYTMVQEGTANTPTSAIPAAIATKTHLLLGLWCSAGQDVVNNELIALASAIKQYGTAFTSLVQGISVGSEDLYRITPTAQDNKENPGADPSTIVKYILQVRKQLAGTTLNKAPIGHVDTWTAWVNSSNSAVVNAVDWVGVDAYPNFQVTMENNITNANKLFFEALGYTKQAAGSKPVWITETGWPYAGKQMHDAVPSAQNAKTYWDEVGCNLFGQANVWWYDLYSPLFGILGNDVNNAPLYDLSCRNPQASKSVSSSAVRASSVASPTNPKTGNATAKATKIAPPVPSAAGNGYSVPSTINNTFGAASSTPTSKAVTSTMVIAYPTSSCRDSASKTCTTSMFSATYLQIPHTASATPTSGTCGNSLTPGYLFPHLIIPLDSTKPTTPQGNSYNGNVSNIMSSVFNFDVPPNIGSKTCSLVFLLPNQKPYTLSGSGGLSIAQVPYVTTSTTFADIAKGAKNSSDVGSVSNLRQGGAYVVSKGSCSKIAGKTVGYLVSATNGTKSKMSLEWFQDSGEPAIGLYMNVC